MYDVPLNLVHCRRFHNRFRGMRSPSSVAAVSSFGTTVYPQRTPVKPAVFEKLRNSMAHFLAPFIPAIPEKRIDIVYLCYPNNPTGTTLTKAELKKWVDYALANDTLILFDAAYEAYIREPDIPHSIYEIK